MSVDTEQLTDFQKGARELFDYLVARAANHWHSHQDLNAICEKENALVLEWAEDGLEEVDEASHSEWKSIVNCTNQIAALRTKVAALEQELEKCRSTTIAIRQYSVAEAPYTYKMSW